MEQSQIPLQEGKNITLLQKEIDSLRQELDDSKRRIHRLTIDSVTHLLKKEGIIDKIMEKDESILDVLNGPLAVVLIDFDDFKEINSQYGHAKGDIYLREISSEIDRLAWGEGDDVGFAFRGKEGDEIVVVLRIDNDSEVTYVERINKFCQDLDTSLQSLGKTFPSKGINRTNPSLSVGTVFKSKGIFNNSSTAALDNLLSTVDGSADKAVYETKSRNESRAKDKLVDVTFYEKLANV